ncbi:MAG: CHAP domain-containing protein [Gammaproteobacteria bacterium]|nr:CHAP domain-containing protein [Gammaproteobacteria bacterium]
MNLNARAVIVFLLFLLIIPIVQATKGVEPLPQACLSDCIQPFNTVLGQSPQGVIAYSNCSARCVLPKAQFSQGVFTGISWQCVEFARRWLLHNFGVVYGSVDIAADIWDLQTVTSSDKSQQFSFESKVNGEVSEAPQRGDLLIYAQQFLNTGHVAVVLKVDDLNQKIWLGEQNYSNQLWQGDYARVITFVRQADKVFLLDPYLLGWKRVIR